MLTKSELRRKVDELIGDVDVSWDEHTDLIALGLDSLRMMRLVNSLRQDGVELGFAELLERPTVDDWYRLIAGSNAPATGSSEEPPVRQPFDLSVMQHAYWIGRRDDQPVSAGSHFYFEFDGRDIEPDRLDTAVRAVLRRHEMLRARFLDDGRQEILPESPWPGLTVRDFTKLDTDEAARAAAMIREHESNRRLDVERGLVLDVQLSLFAGGATRLHFNIDMLVCDAVSFRIVLSDLASAYSSPAQLSAPVAFSYQRYLSELKRRRARTRERAAAYWHTRLANLPGGPLLPLSIEPRTLRHPRVTRREKSLTASDHERLAHLSRKHGLTVSMVLAAAFAETVANWSAEPRFILNVPLFDRQMLHSDVERLVGDFTGSLLLQVDFSEPMHFLDRAKQLHARFKADVGNADYSGVEVQRDLARAGGRTAAPPSVVFTSMIGMGELLDQQCRAVFGELSWIISQTSQVWLDHQITELNGGLLLNWDSIDALFPEGMLDAMFLAYVNLVDWLLCGDSDWCSASPDPSPPASVRTRRTVNATAGPLPRHLLHEGFFEWAARDPRRAALCWGEHAECDYATLAGDSLRIAGFLKQRGVLPGDIVGITLPKGPAQIAAVLGVLAAGGAYLPVGIDQPLQRRTTIYGGAGARFVLADRRLAEAANHDPDKPEFVAVEDALAALPLDQPSFRALSDPAYVIFTSGSTGEPKGVVVSHRAAMNTIAAINDRLKIGRNDRVLALSSLDFDLSVYDIFGFLSFGGTIVLPEQDAARNAERWLELLQRYGVTVWQSAPALLDMLLTAVGDGCITDRLRWAVLGGDWIGLDLATRLEAAAPGCRLVALGGTTETAIHSTIQEVSAVPPHWRSVPYGRPLRNVKCRVADMLSRDRPDWVPGELWIGGLSVADGYLNDPARTEQKFVYHAGERWYRTGDLARYWDDGTLEFLGRRDLQVKIRGQRIETGEIEAALNNLPGIRQAAATTFSTPPRLAAAVVPYDLPASAEDIRRALENVLPASMIPERLFVVERLPLTANGKIDRTALAAQAAAIGAAGAATGARPVGRVETLVALTWAEVLGAPDVSRDQSFFALGGDSLQATRVIRKLRAQGFAEADLGRLFDTPRLADFAAMLSIGLPPPEPQFAADPAKRHLPFPLTVVQRAYWLGRRTDFALGGIGSNWYWEFDGAAVDIARLERCWNTLIQRHEMMRAVIDPDGKQRILPNVPWYQIAIEDGEGRGDSDPLEDFYERMAHRVADLAEWPLFEVRAIRVASDRVRLGFSFDYIVLDALSIALIFSELARLYADDAARLPPLGVSFRDYVTGMQSDPAELARARAFWLERLDNLPPAPELPFACNPAQLREPHFVRRQVWLPAGVWSEIKTRARHHELTAATILAAAYGEILSAFSACEDLTINFTLFDRRDIHPDINRILGDFTSLLLVPYRASQSGGWLARAKEMQEKIWLGIEHRTFSAIDVLRELARRQGVGQVQMPVVFTSTLGVGDDLIELSFPFGRYVRGLSQTPQVWLDNQVIESAGELLINWDAVDNLFPGGLIDAMFAAYRKLLTWLGSPATDWTAPLPDFVPTNRALIGGIEDVAASARSTLLHEGIFSHAHTTPERIAVYADCDPPISYRELSERALRIGGALRAAGIRPGDLVAIVLPRGAVQIIATLGVLAAGAAFVPIGIDQPADRRSEMLQKAAVRLILTDQKTLQTSAFRGTADVLTVEECGTSVPLDAFIPVDPSSLGYVIFTSGSTGEPKGVMMSHAAAMNTIADVNVRFGVSADDRILALSPSDFDLSVYDVFGLLNCGGAIVVVSEDDRREAHKWAELIERHRVTVWNSVPTLLDMLLSELEVGKRSTLLRLALVSGDWIGLDLPARLRAAAPRCRFIALGGATEAGIWSNAYEVSDVDPSWRSIPYGSPLANQFHRVVDSRGSDRPDWVSGELWIGGQSLAAGYIGDAASTATQFVAHNGTRWYRTGDLARYWPDGTLEFLGRTDHQIKFYGYRIELAEIESALEAHPAIRSAVGTTIGDGPIRLVAVVAARPPFPDAEELRVHIARKLPPYMVPQHIVILDELPRGPNAKVDRRAIRSIAENALQRVSANEPPHGETECAIAQIWSAILGVNDPGRNDHYFAAGGDSLQATRLVAQLRQRFGLALSLRTVFEAPTIAQLAAHIGANQPLLDRQQIDEGVV